MSNVISDDSRVSSVYALLLDNDDLNRLRKVVKRAGCAQISYKGKVAAITETSAPSRKSELLPCMDVEDMAAKEGTLNWFTSIHFNRGEVRH